MTELHDSLVALGLNLDACLTPFRCAKAKDRDAARPVLNLAARTDLPEARGTDE